VRRAAKVAAPGGKAGRLRNVVEGTNGIDGKDSCAGACLRGRTEQTADCLRAGALVGHASLLEVPFGLRSATSLATRMPSSTAGGTSALATRRAAPCSKRASSSSSSNTRMCLLVVPNGPAAEPRRALRKEAGGMVDRVHGRRCGSRSSASVSLLPAASGSLSWRALQRTALQGGQELSRGARVRPCRRGLAVSWAWWRQRRRPRASAAAVVCARRVPVVAGVGRPRPRPRRPRPPAPAARTARAPCWRRRRVGRAGSLGGRPSNSRGDGRINRGAAGACRCAPLKRMTQAALPDGRHRRRGRGLPRKRGRRKARGRPPGRAR